MMSLSDLIELQERCRNRLYDLEFQEAWLACQKELNRRAELSTLEIEEPLFAEEA